MNEEAVMGGSFAADIWYTHYSHRAVYYTYVERLHDVINNGVKQPKLFFALIA